MTFRIKLLVLLATALVASPATNSGFVTTSDGVKIHYLEAGRGPAILFVPGWTMPAGIWEAQIRHFSKRWRVVAMDPRSQGESTQATEGHFPERRAQDIQEVVDRLKLAPVVLVGWSLGVPEVLTYVRQSGTGTLRAVALVDGDVGDDPNPQRSKEMWQWLKGMQLDRKRFAEEFVRGMYKKAQPEDYYHKLIALSLKTPTNTAVALLANTFAQGDWRPALAKLDRPVVYIVTPELKQQAEMVRAKFPKVRVEMFENSGHALFVDEADRFNRLLEEFLARP
jgi:microsomal epoxide hydrolase